MIPLKKSALKYSTEWPDHIVLHHTAEFVGDNSLFNIDTRKAQAPKYIEYSYNKLRKKETMYHFIVDQVENDYSVFVSQPLYTKCFYEDLDDEYASAVHIGVIGNYNLDIVPTRMYRVIAYRVIVPVMRMFYLKESDIHLHSAISNNKSVTCPGEFFSMDDLLTQVRSLNVKRAVKRG